MGGDCCLHLYQHGRRWAAFLFKGLLFWDKGASSHISGRPFHTSCSDVPPVASCAHTWRIACRAAPQHGISLPHLACCCHAFLPACQKDRVLAGLLQFAYYTWVCLAILKTFCLPPCLTCYLETTFSCSSTAFFSWTEVLILAGRMLTTFHARTPSPRYRRATCCLAFSAAAVTCGCVTARLRTPFTRHTLPLRATTSLPCACLCARGTLPRLHTMPRAACAAPATGCLLR